MSYKTETELLSKYHVSTRSTFTIVKIKDLHFLLLKYLTETDCSPESFDLHTTAHFINNLLHWTFFFNTFYLGKHFFFPSSPSCSSCSKGNLQSRPRGGFAPSLTPALLMPLPRLWEGSVGPQPAGTASLAFSSPELGIYHTKKTLLDGLQHFVGKSKLLDNIPFKFTMESELNIFFLPHAIENRELPACFLVSGFGWG